MPKKKPSVERKVFADAKARRPLAITADAVGLEFSALKREDEPIGVIACLCIDGPLAQNEDGWFENYESLASRFAAVMGEDNVRAVILKFNSPGGDVAGLFETVKAMRAMKVKPVYAYVDEACYSAAYALAMVADEIYLPASGGVGSVGVITCMVDVTENNAENGIRVEVITSGAQKADGHPDVPLSDDAIERTQGRVDQLADMFFALVADSRGLSPATVKGYEAGIFQGQSAVDAGLADGIMSLAEVVSAVSSTTTETRTMGSKLQAVRDENEKAAAFAAASSSTGAEVKFKHTKKMIEVIESEDEPQSKSDDEEEEDEESEGDEDDAPKKKKDDAKALLALVQQLTGKKTAAGMAGALLALGESKTREAAMAKRIERIEGEREADRVAALVQSGMTAGKLTPSQRGWAMSMSRATLKAYLEATPAMVHTIEDAAEEKAVAKNERTVTKAMAEVWTKMGIKPEQFSACVAQMDDRTYAKLEKK